MVSTSTSESNLVMNPHVEAQKPTGYSQAIYRRLGVLEVWFWENNKLKLYSKREDIPSQFLETNGYEKINASVLLPDLNISLLEECTLISDDILAIDEFEQGI